MTDDSFLEALAGADWLTTKALVARLAQVGYWPAKMSRADMIAHIGRQVVHLVDDDGVPLVATLTRAGAPVYKRVDSLTGADAKSIYHDMRETRPCPLVAGDINALLAQWDGGGMTRFATDAKGLRPLVMLSRAAAAAMTDWLLRQGAMTKAEAQAEYRRLGIAKREHVPARQTRMKCAASRR